MKKSLFWSLFLAGLLIRVLAWYLLPSPLADDAADYQQLALNLLQAGRYFGREGVAFWPPLMPFFLALIYFPGGVNLPLAALVLIFLSLATAVLISSLSTQFFGQKAGNLAFILGLFCFDLALFAPLLMSETLIIFLLVFGFYFWFKKKPFPAFLAWGVTLLGKPIFLPAFFLVFFWSRKKSFLKIKFWGLLIFLFPALLWSLRSSLILKSPVFVSTNGGLNFYIAHNPYAQGSYDQQTEKVLNLFDQFSEAEKNSRYYQAGASYFLSHPGQTLKNVFRKPFYLLATFGGSAEGLIVRKIKSSDFSLVNLGRIFFSFGQLVSYWLLLFGSFYYFLAKKKTGQSSWLKIFLSWPAGYFLVLLVFFTFPRFRIPLLPFLVVLASQGWRLLIKKGSWKKGGMAFLGMLLAVGRDWFKIICWLV